ncbi:hypothetical protein [Nonomuraea aridisoli]|uniref:Carboxypeptidase regulatory-like domain-containing protein n=1 Tax=Nonomuraea aridisoli TaxID=2070368 RepID=A0A2W2DZQ1_9ACTN|nr:hypothetical protein [Nonomuraea aridisoli]PZG17446.1 hypothetical protein C1J01_18110 [Nonomuraea aridisoli]
MTRSLLLVSLAAGSLTAPATGAAAWAAAATEPEIRSITVRPEHPVVGAQGSVRLVIDVIARGVRGKNGVTVKVEPGDPPGPVLADKQPAPEVEQPAPTQPPVEVPIQPPPQSSVYAPAQVPGQIRPPSHVLALGRGHGSAQTSVPAAAATPPPNAAPDSRAASDSRDASVGPDSMARPGAEGAAPGVSGAPGAAPAVEPEPQYEWMPDRPEPRPLNPQPLNPQPLNPQPLDLQPLKPQPRDLQPLGPNDRMPLNPQPGPASKDGATAQEAPPLPPHMVRRTAAARVADGWQTWRFLPDKRLTRYYPAGTWTITATATGANGATIKEYASFELRRETKLSSVRVEKSPRAETVRVRGSLHRVDPRGLTDYGPFGRQRLELLWRPDTSSDWQKAGEATTDAAGAFVGTVKGRTSGYWRVRYSGTAHYAPDISKAHQIAQ